MSKRVLLAGLLMALASLLMTPTLAAEDPHAASSPLWSSDDVIDEDSMAVTVAAELDDPATRDDCRRGGWTEFGFDNQGRCIQFVNTGEDSR